MLKHILHIIGEKFWNIFYWGSFFPRRGSQWSIFPGNSIFASPLTNTFNIYFNSCAVSYIKYDCWKRGGFIYSSDFEMRVYLLRGKFETVEVLFATRKLSRSLFLSQCNVGKLLLSWEIILHQNLTTNTKKYNKQTFILCAIGTQWILRGGHMQTFDGLQMATVEEQKKSWLARLADTFLISFLCLSKF